VSLCKVSTPDTLQSDRSGEKMDCARDRKRNPYPATFGATRDGRTWAGEIICGHNPFLHARLVYDLMAQTTSTVMGRLRGKSGRDRNCWKSVLQRGQCRLLPLGKRNDQPDWAGLSHTRPFTSPCKSRNCKSSSPPRPSSSIPLACDGGRLLPAEKALVAAPARREWQAERDAPPSQFGRISRRRH
jgi:hypothetical protein